MLLPKEKLLFVVDFIPIECFDTAMKEIKLPKYEKWANYDAFLPGNIERFCEFWGRGY